MNILDMSSFRIFNFLEKLINITPVVFLEKYEPYYQTSRHIENTLRVCHIDRYSDKGFEKDPVTKAYKIPLSTGSIHVGNEITIAVLKGFPHMFSYDIITDKSCHPIICINSDYIMSDDVNDVFDNTLYIVESLVNILSKDDIGETCTGLYKLLSYIPLVVTIKSMQITIANFNISDIGSLTREELENKYKDFEKLFKFICDNSFDYLVKEYMVLTYTL